LGGTVLSGVEVGGAELGFVFVGVVEFFYSVVGALALVSQMTLTIKPRPSLPRLPNNILANLALISAQGPTPVLLKVVVVGALLVVVVLGVLRARVQLERGQVEELHALALSQGRSVEGACMFGYRPLRQILTRRTIRF